jgi:glycosyltransferase involved in cell wall biosynthesis
LEFTAVKDIKVLHLVQSIGRNSAGMGSVVRALVIEQQSLDCQPMIWTLDQESETELALETKLPKGYFKCFPHVGPAFIGFTPAMELAARSQAGQEFVLVHQHGIRMANSRVTNQWRHAWDRPTLISPHGTLETNALRISRLKKNLAALMYGAQNLLQATCLHACSQSERLSFRQYGLKQPIAVIPNGVSDSWLVSKGDSESFRREFGIGPGRRIMLFLSRIHPIKGLPLLFEAMAKLRSELGDWLLVIAGPDAGGHRLELEKLARLMEIDRWVLFVGPLFGERKRDGFAAAEVFVLPTRSENFGIVIAEALGVGLPVITTHGAPWEELTEKRCGWWIDISSDAIRDTLMNVIQMPAAELAAMGARGRDLVATRYTWRFAAEKTILLYKWLLSQGGRPNFVETD